VCSGEDAGDTRDLLSGGVLLVALQRLYLEIEKSEKPQYPN
jgi:hypothetical protein